MEIRSGQIWKENDPREQRYVVIVRADPDALVEVRRVHEDGRQWEKSRVTRAQRRRFNGGRGGYSLHRDTK